jgi:hypothetical protein
MMLRHFKGIVPATLDSMVTASNATCVRLENSKPTKRQMPLHLAAIQPIAPFAEPDPIRQVLG